MSYTDPPINPEELAGHSALWDNWHKFSETKKNLTHGFAAMRIRAGARTITQGGWSSESDEAFENMGMIRRGIKDAWHPRSLLRGPTQMEFDPRRNTIPSSLFWKETKSGSLKPGLAEQETRWAGTKLTKMANFNPESGAYDSAFGRIGARAGLFEGGRLQHAFDPKMASRFSAAGDYARMGNLSEGQIGKLGGFLGQSGNDELATRVLSRGYYGVDLTGDAASQAVRLGGQGFITAPLMGYMHGAAGRGVDEMLQGTLSAGTEKGLGVGARHAATKAAVQENGLINTIKDRAVRATAQNVAEDTLASASGDVGTALSTEVVEGAANIGLKEGIGATVGVLGESAGAFGAEVGLAAGEGGLNPVMDAIAIYSAVKLGATVAKIGFKVGSSAFKSVSKSYKGQIGKDPFGMGYRDTEAAATSRARGVMAISNSRLNARSILGSESGMMANHFG